MLGRHARLMVGGVLGAVSWAALASAQTLEDSLALAYTSNPNLVSQRAQVRALDENFVQARSPALPSVSATVQTSTSSNVRSGTDPDFGFALNSSDSDSLSYSLSADQTLYRGGRTRAAMDQALANIYAARAQLSSTEQSVLLDAVSAFMNVRRDEAILDIRANNVAVLERQLDASSDRFEVGEITRTDVSQAEARLAGARSQLAAAQAALTASRAGYERVVGQAPGTLAEPPPLPPLPEDLQAAFDLALENNPDVIAADFAEEAATAGVRNAKGAMLPTVSLSASASSSDSYNSGPFEFEGSPFESESTQVGGRVSIPLYSAGVNSSSLRQARQNEARARSDRRNVERLVRESVSTAWSGYLAAQSQMESTSEQARANELAFEGVEAEAAVGLRTTLDVLNAEQELLNARLAFEQAERDAYVAAYRVLQAIGAVNPAFLDVDVEIYDPAENLSDVRGRYLGIGLLE